MTVDEVVELLNGQPLSEYQWYEEVCRKHNLNGAVILASSLEDLKVNGPMYLD